MSLSSHRLALLLLIGFLTSCGGKVGVVEQDSAPTRAPDLSNIPDAVPKNEPLSKYGNPRQYKVLGKNYYTLSSAEGYREKGIASWYGTKFHGRRTSSGEIYDMYKMTAAHKTLPLPTYVEVTNLENGKKAIVKVNDRGPFHENRVIDLSYSAATKLGIIAKGTGLVEVRALTTPGKATVAPTIKEAAPKVTASVKPLSSAEMFLQVGAFSSLSRAEQIKRKLQHEVTGVIIITPFKSSQGTLYRVRIGPISSVEQGDSLATKLANLGYPNSHIVID
nr:septal ring lytic transglycosylase RlpA family protein [uncultured Methylophaga sp.]